MKREFPNYDNLMSIKLRRELLNYDIFPKVIPVGKEVTITIKPLGGHARFAMDKEHTIAIHTLSEPCQLRGISHDAVIGWLLPYHAHLCQGMRVFYPCDFGG